MKYNRKAFIKEHISYLYEYEMSVHEEITEDHYDYANYYSYHCYNDYGGDTTWSTYYNNKYMDSYIANSIIMAAYDNLHEHKNIYSMIKKDYADAVCNVPCTTIKCYDITNIVNGSLLYNIQFTVNNGKPILKYVSPDYTSRYDAKSAMVINSDIEYEHFMEGTNFMAFANKCKVIIPPDLLIQEALDMLHL